jgi:hemoglobin
MADDPRFPHGPDGPSVHELAGGDEAFFALVERFYALVERDEVLRPVYPEDLEPGKRALALFLAQYWGGPRTYEQERGHPRLRMRHAPFEVTPSGALRWAHHMAQAVRDMQFHAAVERSLLEYVRRFTPQMVNQLPPDDPLVIVPPGS